MNYDSIFAILHMFKEVKEARFAVDKDSVLVRLYGSDRDIEIDCELLERSVNDPYERVQLIEEIIKKGTV